jgi:hypothetical protein
MWCERCLSSQVQAWAYAMQDDGGHISVTAWQCTCCGRLTEEIVTAPVRGDARPQRVRYAVHAGGKV